MTSDEIKNYTTAGDAEVMNWEKEIAYQLALLNEKLEKGFVTTSDVYEDTEYETRLRR